ncbi:ATP-binding cassette sub-family C member 4-like isoform X2 [Phymastichus coffea]|uniref:ATP-binding cassette sub-family C member 4-like isoform X2 n=1 Tax=Phymastichus coffea TaxID=108790 RepID=UPI00273BC7A4|nr:ATP-binding cassette sub-family C member 4-like isoform X2 [Phymastichus coffea]
MRTQWFAEVEKAKQKKRQPNFLRALFWTFSLEFFTAGCYVIIVDFVLRLGTPKLLGAFLEYFKPESENKITYEMAIYYAFGIVIANLLLLIVMAHNFFLGAHVGAQLKIGICSVVYRKALRLSSTALSETAPGKIVNLVASDVNRFGLVFLFLHYMWSAPVSSFIILAFLYSEIGWSALVGFILMFLDVPLQSYMGKLSSKFRLQTSLKTDERVRLMDEIISGVQVIKMYAWEKPFCVLIELARRLELKVVRKSAYIKGIFMTLFVFTTRMALFGTLITMMLRGQELTAEKVFVYMSYFNMMAITMSYMFVRGISEISECKVALKRLQNFLMYDEFKLEDKCGSNNEINNKDTKSSELSSIQNYSSEITHIQHGRNKDEKSISENWSVRLKHVTAKWNLNSSEAILNDIDLEVDKGKLFIVIGTVGAGKSSLIASVLGELKLTHGYKMIKGRVSYADQDAWVFGASVRQNITFGQEFDKQRYQEVVNVCALQQDLQQLPQGDQTIIGERGSSLSGGQKARINLARAVYRDAEIYLLDDPLSAVDAHVGKHLFQDCIQKYLTGKTRILVTHQHQYIKAADAIILLDQGKLYQFVDFNELLSTRHEYTTLIAEDKVIDRTDGIINSSHLDRRLSSSSGKSRGSESKIEVVNPESSCEENNTNNDIYENTSRGTVKGNLLINYIKSGGHSIFALLVPFLFLATQFCVSLNDWFIPVLVNAEESRKYMNKTNTDSEKNILSRDYYMYIYTAIVLSILLIGLTRSLTFYTICLHCSQRLHDLVFSALIRAPMRFFDTNSSGRILNRFSKDLGSIDELLPLTLLDASQCIMVITGALIVTCTVNVLFLIPILFIGSLFYFIRKIYLRTSKNMKRVEGITRAPIFTHLNATLNGIATIRAYQAQSILEKEFDRLQDAHISAWYMFNSASVAFGFSLDFFCFIFTGLVVFSFLLLKDNFSGGTVGLAITQVMSLMGWLQWGIRQSAEVANELMSVERVIEYSQLAPEPNLRDKGLVTKNKNKYKKGKENEVQLTEPPKDWPNKGRIEFKNVYLRYVDKDPPVLTDLTLTIEPSEKVGIVGRTGAGKSSLISAFFRLTIIEGIIKIDGIDTNIIALEDLRKQISIIPQNPVLFSGALRRNLDPFNEFSDEHLWKILEEVELKETVQSTGNGLDHRVQDRGLNYSTGQRQLICLARAILRDNRILMLDEATANVDPQTDALIQRTIRTKFAACTVLTVAHRLNTIMDCDKVLVMDKGLVVEFDHPYLLLKNEKSSFSSLVKETGHAMYKQLKQVAHDAYFDKYSSRL